MKVIQPNCRSKLLEADYDFIVCVLGRTDRARRCLRELVTEPALLDLILDNPQLPKAIREDSRGQMVSRQLYFYLLVRRALLSHGLTERRLADYVASLLADFSAASHRQQVSPFHPCTGNHLVDILADAMGSTEEKHFLFRSHMGNLSLFATGVFPERVQQQCREQGTPSLTAYEMLGSRCFKIASSLRLAFEFDLQIVYRDLALHFHLVRLALNGLSDSFLSVGAPFIDIRQLLNA